MDAGGWDVRLGLRGGGEVDGGGWVGGRSSSCREPVLVDGGVADGWGSVGSVELELPVVGLGVIWILSVDRLVDRVGSFFQPRRAT